MNDAPEWNPNSFWALITASGLSLQTLSHKLERLSKLDLCRYKVAFDNWKSEVNPHDWVDCHPHLIEPCSEDHADDFAAWVVMQGAEFYGEVVSHPEHVQQFLEMFSDCESGRGHSGMRWNEDVDREDYRGCQRADYIAAAIFRTRYGENINEACYDNRGWPRKGLE